MNACHIARPGGNMFQVVQGKSVGPRACQTNVWQLSAAAVMISDDCAWVVIFHHTVLVFY